MVVPFAEIVAVGTGSVAEAETGEPAATAGVACPEAVTEAIFYLGLADAAHTATLQPWLFSPLRSKWYKSGSSVNITGSNVFKCYTNGVGGRVFVQVTAGSNFPITRDVQFVDKQV